MPYDCWTLKGQSVLSRFFAVSSAHSLWTYSVFLTVCVRRLGVPVEEAFSLRAFPLVTTWAWVSPGKVDAASHDVSSWGCAGECGKRSHTL